MHLKRNGNYLIVLVLQMENISEFSILRTVVHPFIISRATIQGV